MCDRTLEKQITNNGIDGFILSSSFCREVYEHGGSAIFVKSGLTWHGRKDLVKMSLKNVIEIAAIDHDCGKIHYTILSIYAPQRQTK